MARTPRRVAIERIPGDAARQVSFSKRRQGLFKKVCELSTLCGAESAVLVHSPAGRVYSLGDPDVNTVVDRFLEYASQPGAAAAGGSTGSTQQQGESSRAPQQQNRRGGPRPEIRRRVIEEDLYRQLAEQDSWCDSAKLHRAALTADMRDKEARLPHRWGTKVQELELGEAEEMADALEELALRVGDLIRAKEEEEGVLASERWSPDDPAPPPSNPWRQAAFMASLGHRGPWPLPGMPPMAGGAANPFAQPAPPPQNPYPQAAAPVAPPPSANYPAVAGFMGASAGGGMGMPMAPMGGSGMAPSMAPGMVGMAPGMAPGMVGESRSYNFASSSSAAALPVNQLMPMQPPGDGEGTSSGLGPHNMFYR